MLPPPGTGERETGERERETGERERVLRSNPATKPYLGRKYM